MSGLTDEQLMKRMQAGDHAALDEIFRRYSLKMLYFFRRMLGQEEKAQDFVQDLFVKLIDKCHLFDTKKKFSTWLYTMAGNMCKNEFRAQTVRQIMQRLDPNHDFAGDELPYSLNMDCTAFQHALSQALLKLSVEHKEVFVLRYQEELSIREISEIVNCAEGTVKSRLFYALKKLATQLQTFSHLLKSS